MSENPKVQRLLTDLSKQNQLTDQLASLLALENRRKEQHFIRYWTPVTEGQWNVFRNFKAEHKIFGVLGGNRSGKSELGAAITVAWALGPRYFEGEPAWEWVKLLPIPEPPNNIWVVGLDFPTLRDVLWREKLRFGKSHPAFLPKEQTFVTKVNDSDYQIFFANGSVITGKSADSGREKFQGASVDLVWIDEEPEVDIFDECYQRTVDCGGKILVTLTPLSDINSGVRTPWVFDLYQDWKSGKKDVAFTTLSVLDNPFVPDIEKSRLREKWAGHPEEKARLYGEFVQRAGLVYNMWDVAKHLVKPFRPREDWMRIVSIDPAATGVTAAVWAAIDPGGNMYLYREYYESDKVISDHAANILVRNAGDKIDIWLIDPFYGRQRNAQTHKTNAQLYREAGIPVRITEVGEDFGLNASFEYMNATVTANARHPLVRVFNDLTNFRFEIEHYVWDYFLAGQNKGQSKEKPRKRDDHLMNAFQYLCALRPRGRRYDRWAPDTESKPKPGANSYT